MLEGYHERGVAQQDSYWTAIGAATGESPRCAPYEHERAEAFLRDRRCLGTLAAATMTPSQNSIAAGPRTLPTGSGAKALRHAAGAGRAHRQHSILADG